MKAALLLAVISFGNVLQDGTLPDPKIATAVRRIDNLTKVDIDALHENSEQSFPLVLRVLDQRIAQFRKSEKGNDLDKVKNALTALTYCAKARRTSTMLSLVKRTKPDHHYIIARWLSTEGDLVRARKFFEDGVDHPERPGFYYKYWSDCIDGLMKLGDATAVRFLVAKMEDRSAEPGVRAHILRTLSQTRDGTALASIRKQIDAGRSVPPVPRRADPSRAFIDIDFPVTRVVDGTVWALFTWDGLGSGADLFIAKKQGDKFIDPMFTGLSTYWPMYLPGGMYTDGGEEHVKEIEELASGAWMDRFVHDQTIRQDSDGDGYTDVVELWLGLDPRSGDTDSDGLIDGKDKNPHAPRRHLSDEEQALRVAIESLVAYDEGRNTFVEFPNGIRPIEIQSTLGIVIPDLTSIKARMTRPNAVFGHRFSFKGPFMSGERATVKYEARGGHWFAGGVVTVVKIGAHWYPAGARLEWSAAA